MFGILNINKPIHCSSRDIVTRVVQAIRNGSPRSDDLKLDSLGENKPGIRKQKTKAGHAGTLDPLASGVLVVCLGKATRLIPYIQRSPKCYLGRFQLDVTSDSADLESKVVPIDNPVKPGIELIERTIPSFTGSIQQKPPAYSAISINGQRAYRLARKGIEFEIKPKTVWIGKLEIVSYRYPELELNIECGSGTYIRSLGRDLARSMGSDAVMTNLVRTSIGNFRVDSSIDGNKLDFDSISNALIDPVEALADLPKLEINDSQLNHLAKGRFIELNDVALSGSELPPEFAAIDSHGKLVAIVEPFEKKLKPKINLA